jgi:hypothetical protein
MKNGTSHRRQSDIIARHCDYSDQNLPSALALGMTKRRWLELISNRGKDSSESTN